MSPEKHFVNPVGWRRASVLGANDGFYRQQAQADRPHRLMHGRDAIAPKRLDGGPLRLA